MELSRRLMLFWCLTLFLYSLFFFILLFFSHFPLIPLFPFSSSSSSILPFSRPPLIFLPFSSSSYSASSHFNHLHSPSTWLSSYISLSFFPLHPYPITLSPLHFSSSFSPLPVILLLLTFMPIQPSAIPVYPFPLFNFFLILSLFFLFLLSPTPLFPKLN